MPVYVGFNPGPLLGLGDQDVRGFLAKEIADALHLLLKSADPSSTEISPEAPRALHCHPKQANWTFLRLREVLLGDVGVAGIRSVILACRQYSEKGIFEGFGK